MKIKFLSKITAIGALLFYTPNISANANLEALRDPAYQSLKAKVQSKLVNTWCLPQKAELIMDVIVSERLNNCVEIGVFTGSSFLPIVSSLKYLGQGHAYAIDAWSNEEAIKYMDDEDPNKNWWAQVNMRKAHTFFQKRIQSFRKYYTELYSTSEEAAHQIGEIDFLHLDGNYTTEGSLEDGILYCPKVKIGGYILVSNAHICIDHDLPKLDLLYYIEGFCDIIRMVEGGNAILYQKIK